MSLTSLLNPKSLEDFLGQEHLIGKDAPLFKALQSKHFPHTFFYGLLAWEKQAWLKSSPAC